jgi:hypothetical protein
MENAMTTDGTMNTEPRAETQAQGAAAAAMPRPPAPTGAMPGLSRVLRNAKRRAASGRMCV